MDAPGDQGGAAEEADPSLLRVLIATDNHLGVHEKDQVRKDDAFITFREIFEIAKQQKVDCVFLGGDLFDINKPSRETMVRTMEILREYCLNDNPVQLEVLSDQTVNFPRRGVVNYEDPNYNVGLPVFMIHGNHDDPAGGENLSAIDLLAACNLVNYFGKHTLSGSGTGKIKLKPVLMQKGNTRIALYGLGYIRDARLHQMFSVKGNVEWARPEDKEGMRTGSWFNAMLIHQNRVHHSPKNAISERYLPSWLDLVVWGHEHECLVEPTEDAAGNFAITQPGSSVVTSLIEGEAKKKQVMLLEVRADDDNPDSAPFWRTVPIPLETTRPFKYKQMSLTECARAPVEEGGLGPDWTDNQAAAAAAGPSGRRGARGGATQHDAWVHDLLERNVNEMIAEATEPYVARETPPGDIPLPLIRLRVDYSGGFSTINGQRFGQKFVGKVANPNDLLQFHKSQVGRKKKEEGGAGAGANAGMDEDEETIGNPQLQDQRRIEQLVNSNLTAGLQLLSENDMSNALDDFVNRDTAAINNLIKQRLAETQALVEEEGDVDELGNPEDAKKRIEEAVQQRLARSAPTAAAQAAAAAAAAAAAGAPGGSGAGGRAAGDGGDDGPTPMEAAQQERERTLRMMDAGNQAAAAGGTLDDDFGTVDAGQPAPPPRNAFDALGQAPTASTGGAASRGRASGGRRGTSGAASMGGAGALDSFLAPSQVSAKPAAGAAGGGAAGAKGKAGRGGAAGCRDGRGGAAAGRGKGRGGRGRAGRAAAVDSDSGDDDMDDMMDDSGDDDDSGDEDVVPLSAPAGGGRGGARPTRAAKAAKAAAATRTRRGQPAPAETPDEFNFDGSDGGGGDDDDDDDDDDFVEDSGDEIQTTRRGQKRKAAAAPAAKKKTPAKKAKPTPPAKPPPGRNRAARVIEIDDDSGDEDDIPATASTRGGRRTTRGR